MRGSTFRRLVTMDETDLLGNILGFLESRKVPFCVIGGQAVNAYIEPLVSLALDIAVAVDDPRDLIDELGQLFRATVHPRRINLDQQGSALRVQIQTDPRYTPLSCMQPNAKEVLGRSMPVARLEDALSGKIWAAMDPQRRGSKRQKDLADIARILEAYPHLRTQVPESVRKNLV